MEQGYIMQIGNANYMMDAANDRIQFLDSRFYRAGDDLYVPSVTTILDAYPKGAAFAEWLKKHGEDADNIRDEAGRRGSVVHQMTEAFDGGAMIELMDDDGAPRYKLNEWAMFERYVEFRRLHPATIHAVELNMVSAHLGYAGTLDRVITIDDTTYIMDIKTSGAIHDPYWYQQAAYHELLIQTGLVAKLFPDGEIPEIKLAILWLNAKTRTHGKYGAIQGPGWQFLVQDTPTSELKVMFDCIRLTWMMANKGLKPRLTTYSLQHSLNSTSHV